MRKIIHIDMDAFYASVEQRDRPEWQGKPLVVGGSERRGVVAAASYEARQFGVRSAMPSATAKRLCPHLIFAPGRFEVYRDISEGLRALFREYTPLVEPLSLDEAYLDVTENLKGEPYAVRIAKELRRRIKETHNLTASAGVSFNKFLAKTASGRRKPDGMTVVTPEKAAAFLDELPIEKFHGVGPAAARKMAALGVQNGADLKAVPPATLARVFGKMGGYYYRMAHGLDDRPVRPDRERKSAGAERTFMDDLLTRAEIEAALKEIAANVGRRLQKHELEGRTVTLKVRYRDFTNHSRALTFGRPVAEADTLYDAALKLLAGFEQPLPPVRLLGLTVANFEQHDETLGRQLVLPFDECAEV